MKSNLRQRGSFVMGLLTRFAIFLLFLAMLPAILSGLIGGSPSKQKLTVDTKVPGVVIGFFNGVNVDKNDSNQHIKRLYSRFSDKTPSGHPIQYQLFYNDSYGLILDVVEMFDQRAALIGLSDHYDLFWDVIDGNRANLERAIADTNGGVNAISDLINASAYITARYLHDPIVRKKIKTSAEHRKLIDKLTDKKSRQSLILLAHSQGNFYGLEAYSRAVSRTRNVSIVHAAPPADVLKGAYVLYAGDTIVNSLRSLGHVSEPNVESMSCYGGCVDTFGHGFADVYFKSGTASGDKTEQAVRVAIDRQFP